MNICYIHKSTYTSSLLPMRKRQRCKCRCKYFHSVRVHTLIFNSLTSGIYNVHLVLCYGGTIELTILNFFL